MFGIANFFSKFKNGPNLKWQALFYQPVNSFQSHNYTFPFFAHSLHGMLHISRLLGCFEFDKTIRICSHSATTLCLSRVRKLLVSKGHRVAVARISAQGAVHLLFHFIILQSKNIFHFSWNFLVSLRLGSELAAELGPCLSS